jgi:hypothetical protein
MIVSSVAGSSGALSYIKTIMMKKVMTWMLVMALMACSGSRITTSWRSKDTSPVKFSKIMVIALLKQNDAALKQRMEDHLTGDLKALGYTVVSFVDAYGPKSFTGLDEEKAIAQIQDKGFDAVMTIVLLDKKQEKEYVPRRVYYTPYNVYQNRFWGYYDVMNRRIETPGYYSTTTNYFWESNLYDMGSKKLLYSVQTESFLPSSTTSLAHEYGKLIVQDMLKQGILVNTSPGAAK